MGFFAVWNLRIIEKKFPISLFSKHVMIQNLYPVFLSFNMLHIFFHLQSLFPLFSEFPLIAGNISLPAIVNHSETILFNHVLGWYLAVIFLKMFAHHSNIIQLMISMLSKLYWINKQENKKNYWFLFNYYFIMQ